MSSLLFCLLLTLVDVSAVSFWPTDPTVKHYRQCSTCNLFGPKSSVTLRVCNVLRKPTFEETVTLNCSRSNTLFYMMQEAAEANTIFRFNVKYYGSQLGFFVEGINGVFGDYTLDKSVLLGDPGRGPQPDASWG